MSERNPYDLFLDALLEPLPDPDELDRRTADWPEVERFLALNNWLEAKKRKERTAKLMETITTAVADKVTLRLADALECFYNASLTHAANQDHFVVYQTTASVAEGLNAVAHRLKEHAGGV